MNEISAVDKSKRLLDRPDFEDYYQEGVADERARIAAELGPVLAEMRHSELDFRDDWINRIEECLR